MSTRYKFWQLHSDLQQQSLAFNRRGTSNSQDSIHSVTAQELVCFMDRYPPSQPASSYGGAFPLSQYNQNETVIVKSSMAWRNNLYALPKQNPSFRKVVRLLQTKECFVQKVIDNNLS